MLGTRAIFEVRQKTGADLAIARFPERLNMRYRDPFSISFRISSTTTLAHVSIFILVQFLEICEKNGK